LVPTDVKVKGSYLPTGRHSTSSASLNMVKHGVMTAATTSGTNGTDTLSTSVIVEDAGKGSGHDDDEVGWVVSTDEGWRVNQSNDRTYILGPADNQDPGGNIDKESGTIWPIDNMTAHHHTLLIVQSDLGDEEDDGSSMFRFVSDIYF